MYITLSCPSGTLSHKWERDTTPLARLRERGGGEGNKTQDKIKNVPTYQATYE